MKLRTHYLILAFAIIVPLAAGSGMALHMLLDAQRNAAEARIEESARSIGMTVDAELIRARAVLRALASSRALADEDFHAFERQAEDASGGSGSWTILYDGDGRQLMNTRLPPARSLSDVDGIKAMPAGAEGRVSGVKWGAFIGEYFVTLDQAITSASGRRYVIAQAFSPAYFARAFHGRAIPPGWLINVVDGKGVVVAGSGELQDPRVKPEQLDLGPLLAAPAGGGLKKIERGGATAYAWASHSQLSDWSVLVAAPAAEIDAVVWQGVAAALAGVLLAVTVAGALALRTGRRLLGFMRRAADAAALLGQGREVGLLRRSSIREMEALNHALRHASDKLQAEMRSRASAENERNQLLVLERQARAVAEEQNAAKDEFLAMLGHELRNPLSAIAAAITLLGDGRGPVDAAERARKVLQRQTAHLRMLVDDLLDVNRALMGKLTLQRERLDLAAVARECVDLRRNGGRLGKCMIRVDTVAAPVEADPTRLMQIVDNILDNAVKYSPEGGLVSVAVNCEGGTAELLIHDAGIGIPADLLPKVFNIFVQGEQTLQRALGGLGIGLTLVRRLVEMHGGTIGIASPGTGLGTSVSVRLPLAQRRIAAPGAAANGGAAPERLKVMLVEDNADAREMLAMKLELYGHDVIQAADGQSALAAAAAQRPELALVDIGLPGMDGYALARCFKQDPATSGMRLVALTGYGAEDSRERALAAGFDLYVTKPISAEQLRRICLDAA
ncbi:MAG TPA: ATP-binding protein [Janthinobacterium sp.]|nr:ATP-binding protein [Janthinobacterium sp.]